MFTYNFVENGGYDCMTDAFFIKENDKIITVIDLGSFGQHRSWDDEETTNKAKYEAEKYAILIVTAVNMLDRS